MKKKIMMGIIIFIAGLCIIIPLVLKIKLKEVEADIVVTREIEGGYDVYPVFSVTNRLYHCQSARIEISFEDIDGEVKKIVLKNSETGKVISREINGEKKISIELGKLRYPGDVWYGEVLCTKETVGELKIQGYIIENIGDRINNSSRHSSNEVSYNYK